MVVLTNETLVGEFFAWPVWFVISLLCGEQVAGRLVWCVQRAAEWRGVLPCSGLALALLFVSDFLMYNCVPAPAVLGTCFQTACCGADTRWQRCCVTAAGSSTVL